MKKVFIIISTAFCCVIGMCCAYSQSYFFDVQTLNTEHGLPLNNIFQIKQDHKGYIWTSTLGNISRYDGDKFKTYTYSDLNIAQNGAIYLALDKRNYLWYCEMNIETQQYSGAIDTEKDSIYSMNVISGGLIDADSVVYISNSRTNPDKVLISCRNGKIYSYEDDFELIYQHPYKLNKYHFLTIAAGFDNDYLVFENDKASTKQIWNIKDKKIQYEYNIDNAKQLQSWVMGMRADSILELFSFKEGYNYYQIKNDTLLPFSTTYDKERKGGRILQLHEDYTIYAAKNQLIIRDKAGNILLRDSTKLGALQGQKSIMTDRQNILWIATVEGLVRILAHKNPFEIINKSTVYKGNSIRGIYEDEDYLWWSGYNENLRRNRHTGEISTYSFDKGGQPKNFFKDDEGHLWCGNMEQWFHQYIPEKDTFKTYKTPFWSAYPFQNTITKNFWVGTGSGWYAFDKTSGQLEPFPLPIDKKNVYVRQFLQNEDGIWIATAAGIFLMDNHKETLLKHYTKADGFSSDNINHIHKDAEGIYWIATKGAGLMRWDRKVNSFKAFTKENVLKNNNIYAVYEDEFERLWLPSDEGLMCFDKTTYETQVFLEKDGIAHKEFNTFAHFKTADDSLIFGGIEGITKFHPKDINTKKTYEVPIYVNKLSILENSDEYFTDKTDEYLSHQAINFSPKDKILTLDMSLLDYRNTDDRQYAYRLDNQQWSYTRDNKITIINPSYGHYTLSVKGKTASGEWSEVIEIPLHVKAPFYRQIWFFIVAGLLAVGLIFLFVRQRIKRLEKDRTRLEEEVKKRTVQIERDKETIEKQAAELRKLDETKSRFFSNITHEFRTPLTLVTGPAEQLLADHPPENMRRPLRGILKNARSLLGLINQLLDIAKIESAQMRVEISHGDIVEYTKSLVYQFEPLAAVKHIELDFKPESKAWETNFDKDKWAKIVTNLVSNAVKFTHENGNVCIKLNNIQKNKKDTIQLIVKDKGQGISPEYLPKIFDRFYRSSDHSHTIGGTGIGLALVKELITLQHGKISVKSTLGEGSEFTVMLPVAHDSELSQTSLTPPKLIEVDLANYGQNATAIATEVSENNKNKLHLLIIEDNAEMRSFIRSCIDKNTYIISEAADGEEGIQKALDIVPDLIISDVMMPKVDGFGLVQAIRNSLATSHIPLILLTAKASLESRMEGFGRGADAFMSKPFSPTELTLRVRKLIEIRMMLQSRYQNSSASSVLKGFQKEDKFISELKTYIIENIDEPNLTGESISSHFGMSRMQLHRKLKALIQHTPAEYVRSIRLENAMQLLQAKDLNISEIAYQTGFSSPSHFSRAFKNVYGKTPSEFSKSQ